MNSLMYEMLKRTYRGDSIIQHITNIEEQLDMQTKARLTAEECLRDALEKNKVLKEKLDNVKRQSHG